MVLAYVWILCDFWNLENETIVSIELRVRRAERRPLQWLKIGAEPDFRWVAPLERGTLHRPWLLYFCDTFMYHGCDWLWVHLSKLGTSSSMRNWECDRALLAIAIDYASHQSGTCNCSILPGISSCAMSHTPIRAYACELFCPMNYLNTSGFFLQTR